MPSDIVTLPITVTFYVFQIITKSLFKTFLNLCDLYLSHNFLKKFIERYFNFIITTIIIIFIITIIQTLSNYM